MWWSAAVRVLALATLVAGLAPRRSGFGVARRRLGVRMMAPRDFSPPAPAGAAGDGEFYTVTLSRATGVDWASDLSFRWVYAREVEIGSSASLAGVQKGHQLVEVRSVAAAAEGEEAENKGEGEGELLAGAGASFTQVMDALASLPKDATEVEMTFFAGNKKALMAALQASGELSEEAETVSISVTQEGKSLGVFKAPRGSNLRNVLIGGGINVYRSVTRWSNCNGKQLCGTCIVNVHNGGEGCSAKSIDEASTLRENPDEYRLSCVTFVYGDIEVEVLPPKVTAAQWTR